MLATSGNNSLSAAFGHSDASEPRRYAARRSGSPITLTEVSWRFLLRNLSGGSSALGIVFRRRSKREGRSTHFNSSVEYARQSSVSGQRAVTGESAVHWYKHHLGDYSTDTAGLSLLEHGAYRLLLDAYYSNNGPLPCEMPVLYRICHAINNHEKAAVQFVIKRFFTNSGMTIKNNRADQEILKYQAQCSANRRRIVPESASKPEARSQEEATPPPNTTYSGAAAPFDPDREVWRLGLEVLMAAKVPERQARAIIGKHYKRNKSKLLEVLCDMAKAPVIDPIPYLEAALNPKGGHDKVVL